MTTFLEPHRPGAPLLIPNPWDVGSAMLLASLGFEARATTSSGFAATLVGLDGSVARDQAIANGAALAARCENHVHGRAIWPTPSPGCRPTRWPAPTCSSPRRERGGRHPLDRVVAGPALQRPRDRGEPNRGRAVARISVGGAFAYAAIAAVVDAAPELRDQGTYGYTAKVPGARAAARDAFSRSSGGG